MSRRKIDDVLNQLAAEHEKNCHKFGHIMIELERGQRIITANCVTADDMFLTFILNGQWLAYTYDMRDYDWPSVAWISRRHMKYDLLISGRAKKIKILRVIPTEVRDGNQ
jgi:hypothetical protein